MRSIPKKWARVQTIIFQGKGNGEGEEAGKGEGEGVSPAREGKTKQKQRWLLAAVTRGDEAEVAKLLATDPTLLLIEEVKSNTCHPSALHIAAFHGFDKIVALLL